MKIIITVLLIVLAFSSYMALTTECRIISPPKLEMAPYVTPPAAPLAPIPAPPQADTKPEMQMEEDCICEIEAEEDQDGETETIYCQEDYEETQPIYASNNSIEQEIVNVFKTESRIALAIAKAESRLNPRAVNKNRNGSKDIGIFQINDKHGWSANDRFDWRKNIQMAKELRDRHGWTEWSVYNNGTYRNFL